MRIWFRYFLNFCMQHAHVLSYDWSVLFVLQLAMERTPSVKAAPCAPETMGVWTASQNSSCFCGGRGWGSMGSVSMTVQPDTTACAVQTSTCAQVSLYLPPNLHPFLSHTSPWISPPPTCVSKPLVIYWQLSRGDTHTSRFERLICPHRWMEVAKPCLNSISTGIQQQVPASVNAVSCFSLTLH